MGILVSVVSHEHTDEIINDLQPHLLQAHDITFVIKDNTPCIRLERYCDQHSIDYLKNDNRKGFGQNHNEVFLYSKIKHNLKSDDLFIVLNPDVIVAQQAFRDLNRLMEANCTRLAAPNLFKDREMNKLEASVRIFPYPWDFITSFLMGSRRTTVKDRRRSQPMRVDWASGAFLGFRASLYKELSGFDPRYYLYCEDIDICWRASKLLNETCMYFPTVKAVHAGHRDSHKAPNTYLWWHVTSAMKFSWVRTKTKILGRSALAKKLG